MVLGQAFSERNLATAHPGITTDGITKLRRPSAGWDPILRATEIRMGWIPACAGMTLLFCLTECHEGQTPIKSFFRSFIGKTIQTTASTRFSKHLWPEGLANARV